MRRGRGRGRRRVLPPGDQADALSTDRYPLVSALGRPAIVRHLGAAARKHGATTVAHGRTGKGDGQVRSGAGIVAPALTCVAPVRDYAMTRDRAIAFREAKHLPIATTRKSPHSLDRNVFGRAVGTGCLEDTRNGPIEGIHEYTQKPSATSRRAYKGL